MTAVDWIRKRLKHEMAMLNLSPPDVDATDVPTRIQLLIRYIPDSPPRCALMKGFLRCLQHHYLLCEVYGYPLGETAFGFKIAMDDFSWLPPYREDDSVGVRTDKVLAFVESVYDLSHHIRGHEQSFRSTDLYRTTYPE